MRAGFTLIEVVVALIVLEVAVVGVLGSLVLSSDIARQAETVQYATARAESVLDSLRGGAEVGQGAVTFPQGIVAWTVGTDGVVRVVAMNERDEQVLAFTSRINVR